MDDLKKEVPIVSKSLFSFLNTPECCYYVCQSRPVHLTLVKYGFLWKSFHFRKQHNYVQVPKTPFIQIFISNAKKNGGWGDLWLGGRHFESTSQKQETDSWVAVSGCPDILISQVTCMHETYLIWFALFITHFYCMHSMGMWKFTAWQKTSLINGASFFPLSDGT